MGTSVSTKITQKLSCADSLICRNGSASFINMGARSENKINQNCKISQAARPVLIKL